LPNVNIQVGLATVNMAGIQFMQYADNYYRAAQAVGISVSKVFDPVPYQLYCQALELRLKAFAWFKNTALTRNQIKNRYWHDLSKLWSDAKGSGLGQFIDLTAIRDAAVDLVAPYYKDRKFCYTDIVMQFRDADVLRRHADLLPTLAGLVEEMRIKLERPITSVS
jgi:hypothetical protein